MRGYLTKAFVLRKFDLREADQIITLYTAEKGKVRAIAKGIKKSGSRNVGNLELFNLIEVFLAPGKNLEIVTQVKVAKSFAKLKGDLKQITLLYYLADLVDHLIAEDEKVNGLFELLEDFLVSLERESVEGNRSLRLRMFELKLIDTLGFALEIYHCVHCRKELILGEPKFFAVAKGGIVCNQCRGEDPRIIRVSNNSVKVLRLMLTCDFDFLIKLKVAPADFCLVSEIIKQHLLWILERQLKTLKVIHALNQV